MPQLLRFYRPSITEIMIPVGSFAGFLMLFSLFTRYPPIISNTELKEGIKWLRQSLRDNYYPGIR